MSERVLTVGGNKATRPITDFMIGIAGTEFYVGPNATGSGDDGRSGRSKETSLATLEAAIALATASKNDIIYLLPGHAETVATAGAISIDKIGLRVIGLGTGALRPTFTFSATDATLTMTAASCVLENVILKPSVDSVVSPIVVSAADCKIDVEVQDASAAVECVNAILTTAAADRLDIKLKYRGFTAGNACVNAIRLVGVDTARIYIDFYGVASTAIVEFHTTLCTDIDIKGKFYNHGTSLTKNVVDTVTGSFWSVQGWDGNSNANFSGGDNAAIASDDVTTIATAIGVVDGYHDVPTADAVTDTVMRDVVGRKTDAGVQAVTTTKSLMAYLKGVSDILAGTTGIATFPAAAAAANAVSIAEVIRYMSELQIPRIVAKESGDMTGMNSGEVLFTVTGDVLMKVGASVDVAVTSTSGTTTMEVGVAGNTAVLCVQDAVDNTAFAIGDSWSLITAADANGAQLADEWLLVGNGVDVILTISADDLTAGEVDFYCQYIPLTSGSSVVAA